jgi:hypothetical protein
LDPQDPASTSLPHPNPSDVQTLEPGRQKQPSGTNAIHYHHHATGNFAARHVNDDEAIPPPAPSAPPPT